jgi:hypothetical protein
MEFDFRRKVGALAVTLFLLVFVAGAALAQVQHGSLTGTVTDPSGAVVPGVKVMAVDTQTNLTYSATTDSSGSYYITNLPYGFYRVTFEVEGFAKAVSERVQVNLGQASKVSPKLTVATVGTEVIVTSEQSAVETTSSELKASVDRRQILELPLPTRNPLDLVRTMPGIVTPTSSGIADAFVHGLRGNATNITQDGINVADNFVKTSSFFSLSAPTVDAVGEFSVTTSGVGADAGFGAAQVSMRTARGGNNVHGSLFWFQRTRALNANTFFNKAAATPIGRPFQLQNRVGFNIGGPAYLPGIYDGRNKTFWFFNYEAFREPRSQSRTRTVMGTDARTGLFTYTPTCTAVGVTPTTADDCPAGVTPGVARTVNLLTLGNRNTIDAAVMDFYNAVVPAPNSDSGCTSDNLNVRCFTFNLPGSNAQDRYTLRVDQQVGANHGFEFVFNQSDFGTVPDFLNGIEPQFPSSLSGTGGQTSRRQVVTAAWHSTWGANRTNELRFGFQRAPVDFAWFEDYSNTGGFQMRLPGNLTDPTLTQTNLPQGRNTPVRQLLDNFAWVKGKRTIRFGGEYKQVLAQSYFFNTVVPLVTMGDNASSNPMGLDQSAATCTGTGCDFAGGISSAAFGNALNILTSITGNLTATQQGFNHTSPTSGFVPGSPRTIDPIQHNVSAYLQDSWKFRPNLTLNYGVRWEFQGVYDQRNGLILAPTNGEQGLWGPTPVDSFFSVASGTAASDPTQNVLLDFGGGRNGSPLWKNDWTNFAPFLGFAWDPWSDGKTSIRGGASMSFTQDGFTLFQNAATSNTGLFSVVANNTPTGIFSTASNPLPAAPVASFPVSQKQNFINNTGANLWYFDENLHTPYVISWNFSVQREIWQRITVEARYVGNHAVGQYRSWDVNELNLQNSPFTSGVGSVPSMLQEFINAQSNLAISRANGGGNNFRNQGLAGQVPLPIFTALFGSAVSANFANTTFLNNLDRNEIGTIFNTLRTSNTFRANREANFPWNFFVANPFAGPAIRVDNSAWSYYHGLELEARRRFRSGLFFQANYTFSKVLTDQRFLTSQTEFQRFRSVLNPKLDKNRAAFDITHSMSANFLYPLPFGRGQLIGRDVPSIVDKFIGGWSFQGLTRVSAGAPFTVGSVRFTTAMLENFTASLQNMTAKELQANIGRYHTANGIFWINPDSGLINPTTGAAVICTAGQTTPCFSHPGLMEAGNTGFLAFDSPWFWNQDVSVIKRTPLPSISEKFNFEVRFEFFNALNHANFTPPGSTATTANNFVSIDSTSFGKLNGLVDNVRGGGVNARIIQWAIRVNF